MTSRVMATAPGWSVRSETIMALDAATIETLVGLLLLLGAVSAVRGTRQLVRGLGLARPLDVVRGIRGYVIAIAVTSIATGVLWGQRGCLVFGGIVLAEELYETGILATRIRRADAAERQSPNAGS